jgi:HK97 family phage portal protein
MMPGLLARLFGRTKSQDLVEQRRGGGISSLGSGPSIYTGGTMFDVAMIENLATITACVSAISSAIASLPPRVYRREGSGRMEAPSHPVARLIEAPNENQTWPDWIEWAMAQALLHGNAVSLIEYDGRGAPTALKPIPWQYLLVSLVNGKLAFDVMPYTFPFGAGTVAPGRYLADEVWHLRDRSDNGLTGRARLSRAPQLLVNAISLQEFSTAQWQNGAQLSGVLKMPGALSPEANERLAVDWANNYGGARRAGRTAILENGLEYSAIGSTAEDAQMLESRRFTTEELCRLMGVPPPLVQDYTNNTFTNSQQADEWYARHTLLPWVGKIEREFGRTIFGPGSEYSLELDLSGLMRGSYAERWAANVAAVAAGILRADEVREQEGFAPSAAVPKGAGEAVPGGEAGGP